ncbi:hypothetical protein [Paenibacillus koleovorans]|uniref:hypothetical protein n=1 Tax=Paenibacillus koleovorans TaxID=121608 RepID=UPI000FDBFE9A|nr:hypothetical protein [Paenibacillus koleovorans]
MYLHKINRSWSDFMSACGMALPPIRITNTTRLDAAPGMYMLELTLLGQSYHLYHKVGAADEYELRIVAQEYPRTTIAVMLGIDPRQEKDWLLAVEGFMALHYNGIQTCVDCKFGLESAKSRIFEARFK